MEIDISNIYISSDLLCLGQDKLEKHMFWASSTQASDTKNTHQLENAIMGCEAQQA